MPSDLWTHYRLMLGDGANVCPGTSLANLAALTDACEEYGLPAARPNLHEGQP